MSNDDAVIYTHKLDIFLIAVGSAGVVVTIYHCIVACWCNHRRGRAGGQSTEQTPPPLPLAHASGSTESSVVNLIPAHKYRKRLGLDAGDGTCAICISEFEEGEQVRTLPECMHSYHVPCIDMWLYSHSSCPMCRAEATPSSPATVPNGGLQIDSQQNLEAVVGHQRRE